ncbi:syntaxin-5 [Cimex lectularius]|uniref:t-SNARE coiled-coil homology domain-containing protein n=1 Tax=Cimex lectularius TaxID=79782 RepID=A0A8I6S0R9_CIMLE|nr:syntaxin-5 [Cimex lectularius]
MSARRRRGGSESEQQQPLIQIDSPRGPVVGNGNAISARPSLKQEEFGSRMSRDRTKEFHLAVRSLQGRNIVRAVAVKDATKAKHLQNYGEFRLLSSGIGKNISSTYTKLEKLTLLAKRKPLFNDQPAEIQELTYIIKEDLSSLNTQIARLQDITRRQNETRNQTKAQHLFTHSSSIVLALQSKLASMSSQFKHVLEVRTENLKEAKKRREQFSQGTVSASAPHSVFSGGAQGSVLLSEDNAVTIDMSGQPTSNKQMQLVSYDETDQYLTSRAETMQNIESTIVELGGIFQQLAHMVKEQEEMVDRIDTNVQDTELNVEAAHREILKYFQSVTSNRWLMIKIFAVLIFFFMFFIIFMA